MRKNRNIVAMPILFTTVSVMLAVSAFLYLIYRAMIPDMGIYNTANANYYNSLDGKYYADAAFKIPATDYTEYLEKLLASGGEVSIPEGNYLCKSQISIKGKDVTISGVPGKTKIVFEGSSNTPRIKSGVGAFIVNGSYSKTYNADTAQNITIKGITFEYRQKTEYSINTVLEFANVCSGKITDCSFVSDQPSENYVTLMDLNSCCKNITVGNCKFENMTGASKGSCIWIRNRSDTTGQEQNTTENITVIGCAFTQNSADEIVAVYSSIGNVRNVFVGSSSFYDYSAINVKIFAVYPSDTGYGGITENVQFSGNEIIAQDLANSIITIGRPNRANRVSDIAIVRNKIKITNSSDVNGIIIYVNDNQTNIQNVNVSNNTIEVNKLINTTAIYNADSVSSNKVVGELRIAIVFGKVSKNIIDGALKGIVSPELAQGNEIKNCRIGISCGLESILIQANHITIKQEDGLCGIEVQNILSGQKPQIFINENKIATTNKDQYAFIIHGGTIKRAENKITGPSKKSYINSNAIIIN